MVYYIAFPAFTFLLCVFTYQLGFKRGISHSKKEQISKVLDELEKTEIDEDSKLTYYQELHEEKNPIVEQINADQEKKAAPTVSQNAPTAKTTTTVSSAAPTSASTKTSATESASSTSIQVGAFTDLGKADELIDRLKNSGFDAYTKPVLSKGNELYRVLVKSSKSDVAKTQSKLLNHGYSNTFVVTK